MVIEVIKSDGDGGNSDPCHPFHFSGWTMAVKKPRHACHGGSDVFSTVERRE